MDDVTCQLFSLTHAIHPPVNTHEQHVVAKGGRHTLLLTMDQRAPGGLPWPASEAERFTIGGATGRMEGPITAQCHHVCQKLMVKFLILQHCGVGMVQRELCDKQSCVLTRRSLASGKNVLVFPTAKMETVCRQEMGFASGGPAEAERASAAERASRLRRAEEGPLTDSRLSRRLDGSSPAIALEAAASLSTLLARRLLHGRTQSMIEGELPPGMCASSCEPCRLAEYDAVLTE